MEKIKTENFVYEKYDSNNVDHLNIVKELSNDELTKIFFKDFKYLLENTDNELYYSYIVSQNDSTIGIITLTRSNINDFIFSHIINPKYRGNRYSSIIKTDFLKYLFKNNLADNIICYIDKDNKRSISSMLKTNPSNIENNGDMFKITYTNPILLNNKKLK